jgi:hypothetical protein
MSFLSDLTQGNDWFFYFTVSGHPHVWASTELPGTWSTGGQVSFGGELYDWLPDIVSEELEPIDEQIECWAGAPMPYSFNLQVALSSQAVGILNRNRYRSALTQLTADINRTASIIPVKSTGSFPSSGKLYLGTETITYTGKTSTSFTGCTRGRWGSRAVAHKAYDEVADHSLTDGDRTIRLWVANSSIINGQHYPVAAAPFSTTDRLICPGQTTAFSYNDSLDAATWNALSLVSVVDREIATKLPTGRPVTQTTKVLVDEWSAECGVTYGGDVQALDTYTLTASRGLVPFGEVFAEPSEEHRAKGRRKPRLERFWVDGLQHWKVTFVFDYFAFHEAGLDPAIQLGLQVTPRSLWAELGFEDGAAVTGDGDLNQGTTTYVFEAPKPVCQLRLPGPRTIYVSDETEASIGDTLLSLTGADFRFLKVGEEIVEAAAAQAIGSDRAIAVRKRGVFGSSSEAVYKSQEDDPVQVVAPVAGRMPWPEAILRLLISGSGDGSAYDSGWEGWGAGVPSALVDDDSFESLITDGVNVEFCVTEPTPLRDIIEPWLVAHQCYLFQDSQGRLALRRIPMPLATDIGSAIVLDDASIVTVAGLSADASEQNIVNKVKLSGCGFNFGSGDGKVITLTEPVSARLYKAKATEIDFRGFGNLDRCERIGKNVAANLFGRWSAPFTILTVNIAGPAAFAIDLGTAVSVNHDLLPDIYQATIGQQPIAGIVFGRQVCHMGPNIGATLRIVVEASNGARNSLYAPALRVIALDTKTGELEVEPNFWGPSSGVKDLSFFAVDMRVKTWPLGEYEAAVATSISSLDLGSNKLVLNDGGPLAWTPPFDIVFDDFEQNLDAVQRLYVFIANGNASPEVLNDGTDDYQPFAFG